MTPAGAASLVALLAALMIGGGTMAATERMEREAARQRACEQLVREELRLRPLAAMSEDIVFVDRPTSTNTPGRPSSPRTLALIKTAENGKAVLWPTSTLGGGL